MAADFHTCINDAYRMVNMVNHPVDIIVDMTKATFIGTSFLSAQGNSEAKVQDNQRMAILVGAPAFIRALVNIGKKIAPKTTKNIHFAKTVDEAIILIGKTFDASVLG
ncbi:MAG: hypothetical protein H0X30_01800 [Anaerolineae bacterium]|nr:hypothetical protein [Anaerolineae bacterium]